MCSVCQKKIIIFLLILIDQLAKFIVLSFFKPFVFYNQGVAFGLLPSSWWLVINFFVLIIVVIKLKQKWPQILILAGGFSNLIDRFFHKRVVDFINLPFFPSFNLADAYICLGIIVLLLTYVGSKDNLPR